MPVTRTSGQGRRKGSLNRFNSSIKEMILGALCAAGGQDYLLRQAEQNPVAFLGLVGKVLPLQLAGAEGGALVIDFRWADPPAPPPTIEVSHETNDMVTTVTFADSTSDIFTALNADLRPDC